MRYLGRETHTHCAISDGEVVLDPTFRGNRYHSHIVYLEACQQIDRIIVVPLDRPIQIDGFADPRPKTILPVFIRWLTLGYVRPTAPRGCVETVLDVLATAGVMVPQTRRVMTIREMVCHLTKYEQTDRV